MPVSLGGNNNLNNLVTACRHCNRKKRNNLKYNQELSITILQKAAKTFNVSVEYLMGIDGELHDIKETNSKAKNLASSMAYWGGVVDNAKEAVKEGENLGLILSLLNDAVGTLKTAMA